MADSLRPVILSLQRVTDGLIIASDGLVQANNAMKSAFEATLAAQDEHEDLRDTVHRLEGLVIQLSTEIRELRDRPNP
jgi:ABC-type transporter Mla subunit MlaD